MCEIIMYTDGASSPHKTKNGSWAVIILLPSFSESSECITLTASGVNNNTTNNRMELAAVLKGITLLRIVLKEVLDKCRVLVYTDSVYVIKGFTEWRTKWERENYDGVKNTDLWKKLYFTTTNLDVSFVHVRGHSGVYYNEEADRLAVQTLKQYERRESDAKEKDRKESPNKSQIFTGKQKKGKQGKKANPRIEEVRTNS